MFGLLGAIVSLCAYFGIAFGFWPLWLGVLVAAGVLPLATALAAYRRVPTARTERALGASIGFALPPLLLMLVLATTIARDRL